MCARRAEVSRPSACALHVTAGSFWGWQVCRMRTVQVKLITALLTVFMLWRAGAALSI
jgi:hypothetical protein